MTVEDLICAEANAAAPAKIPAAAVQVRKVRNFLKGEGHSRLGHLLPYILQEFESLDLQPGVTRALWLTVTVPDSARAGRYIGALKVLSGGQTTVVPIELTVHPFRLDKVTDITLSVTGSSAGTFTMLHPELDERWWQIAELVMKNQAEHGMNAVTGGPSAVLRGIRDGRADIDYSRMDRWMALAKKYGLTMPGDSYQGFDVAGVPTDHSRDCVARCEAAAREQYGVSYEDLLRIVYGDLERHARQQGWPPRVYYFLDEPRPEYGNVQPCAELIKIRTRACPDTLFSGYYSTGNGRDVYFETMPVSIAHVDQRALGVGRQGTQADLGLRRQPRPPRHRPLGLRRRQGRVEGLPAQWLHVRLFDALLRLQRRRSVLVRRLSFAARSQRHRGLGAYRAGRQRLPLPADVRAADP